MLTNALKLRSLVTVFNLSDHSWAKTFDQNGPKIKNDQMQHCTSVTSGRKGHFEFFLNHFCVYSCLLPTNILTA